MNALLPLIMQPFETRLDDEIANIYVSRRQKQRKNLFWKHFWRLITFPVPSCVFRSFPQSTTLFSCDKSLRNYNILILSTPWCYLWENKSHQTGCKLLKNFIQSRDIWRPAMTTFRLHFHLFKTRESAVAVKAIHRFGDSLGDFWVSK